MTRSRAKKQRATKDAVWEAESAAFALATQILNFSQAARTLEILAPLHGGLDRLVHDEPAMAIKSIEPAFQRFELARGRFFGLWNDTMDPWVEGMAPSKSALEVLMTWADDIWGSTTTLLPLLQALRNGPPEPGETKLEVACYWFSQVFSRLSGDKVLKLARRIPKEAKVARKWIEAGRRADAAEKGKHWTKSERERAADKYIKRHRNDHAIAVRELAAHLASLDPRGTCSTGTVSRLYVWQKYQRELAAAGVKQKGVRVPKTVRLGDRQERIADPLDRELLAALDLQLLMEELTDGAGEREG